MSQRYDTDNAARWLERVERGLNRVPLLRAFLIRVLICRLGITSLSLLIALTLLAAVVAVLLVVGIVGASVSWWLRCISG
ncbi:MAG: hypothetical protein IJ570_05070 [Prevotella sp.]|nr:hypothetical protein [Prevotella sp.]